MSLRPNVLRVLMVVLAAVFLAAALALRATTEGIVRNASGTALYASMVYAAVVFLAPRVRPGLAGIIATGFCWAVELSQLTGVPAALSAHSVVARLVLGVAFDAWDMVWYPVGVVPLVVAHWLLRHRRASIAPA
jgi:hypothetical protein